MEPPEAKKPRIDSTSKHQALKEKQEARKTLFLRFKNGEIDEVIKEIKAKKAFLRSNKSNVKVFFEESVEEFWHFETLFTMLASEMLTEPSKCNEKSFEALHEVIKLLTSCCVSSSISAKSAPSEIFSYRNKNVSLPKLFTQILESGGDRMSTKTRVILFDYISGLCTRKEGLIALSSFSAFVDQIAICISAPIKEIRAAALSTVMFNSNKKFFLKAFLNSNGGYYIGELLSKWNFDEIKTKETPLLTLFENFSTFDKRSFGRQIATSPGSETFKEILFVSDENTVIHKWHKLIIDLSMNAFELRDAYGRETIERVIKEYDSSDTKLKFLTLFAHDSWSRAILRVSGGLELIMEGCSDTFDTKTFFIAKNFGCFMHDQETLIFICRNDAFLDKILFLLQKYCNETKDKDCPPPESRITLRPDSPNFLQHLEEQRQNMNITNFYSDFADLEASLPAQGSSSPRIRSAWSPSASRTSVSPSPSPSSVRSTFSDDDSDAWTTIHPKKADIGWYSDSEDDELKKEMCREKRREKIVMYFLDVLDWFSHYTGNHVQLLRKPVFETLISLFSTELPISYISKACRSIKRLIRSEESLPFLLGLKLHLHIISLIRRPCLMHRYADRCPRCEDRRKFGREVIQELSLQANSVPGWNFMQELLKSDDPDTQFYAWSTALTLIREVQYRSRLFYYFDVLTKLLDTFKLILQIAANEGNKLLNPDDVEEESNSAMLESIHQVRVASLKENEPKLKAILFSFASLLSHKMQSSILETQTEPFPLDNTDEICRLENLEIPPEKQIRFKNANGDLLVTANQDSLCHLSEYYRGMFENDFSEKLEHQQDFVIGNEGIYIRDEQFIKFIHLLSGCKKSQCVAVDETSTCISLIYLADKYLATELLETMFLPTGIAGRFVTGSTLSSFAPIILTALSTHGRFSDLFFFVFLRYASMNEICDTLAASLSFRSGDTFCDLFKEFLERCISSLPIHQSYRLWI